MRGNVAQLSLLEGERIENVDGGRRYRPILTAVENEKGVLDVDTVKGCTLGMSARPNGGCYNECYAFKIASRYNIDFTVAVSRRPGARSWRLVGRYESSVGGGKIVSLHDPRAECHYKTSSFRLHPPVQSIFLLGIAFHMKINAARHSGQFLSPFEPSYLAPNIFLVPLQ